MAAMLQQSPVTLRAQQPQDSKLRFNQNQQQEAWSYPQQQITNNNPYYYSYQQYPPPPPFMYQTPQHRPHRPRTQSAASSNSSGIQPQKSSSTPTSCQQQRKHRPNPSNTSNTNDHRRPKSTLIQQVPSSRPIPMPADSGRSRRSSITSNSSTVSQSVSIRSEMSLGAKLSLSKRLRKVFSVSSLRSSRSMGSLVGASSSNVSIATMDTTPELYGSSSSSSSSSTYTSSPITPSTPPPPQRSLRRRSFASLSTLFQKSATSPSPQSKQQQQPMEGTQQIVIPDKKDRPTLRVDTTQSSLSPSSTRKTPFKGRSPVVAPDSPNSSVSTRSPTTKQTGLHRLASELPSPTPSSSSSSSSLSSTSYNNNNKQQQKSSSPTHQQNDELPDDFEKLAMAPPPVIGVHYGLPMHGSPRLKPAAHSSSSSLIDQVTPLSTSTSPSATKRRLQFCPTVQVHETFAASDYDRRCDNNATCQKLTPTLALKIKQEINEYKLTEMDVHLDSRQYTQFFL